MFNLMTTKFVGLKDFRQNLSTYVKQVESGKLRLIVLNKNKPVLKVNPIELGEFTLENLYKETAEAREEVKRGEVYTLEEVRKELGL